MILNKIYKSLEEVENFINLFEIPIYVENEIGELVVYNNAFSQKFNLINLNNKNKIWEFATISSISINEINKLKSEKLNFQIIEYTSSDFNKIKYRDISSECFVENLQRKLGIHFLINDSIFISELKYLQKEKLFFGFLLKFSNDAISIKDKNGFYKKVNKNFCDKIALQENEILNKTDKDIFNNIYLNEIIIEEKELIEGKKSVLNKTEKFINVQGDEKWYSTSKFPLTNENGEIVGIISISKDISSIKKVENENERLRSLYKLISQVSTIFLKNTYSNFNKALINVLKEINNFLNSSYVAVYSLNEKSYRFERVSEYPLAQQKIYLDEIFNYKSWFDKLSKGEFVFQDITETYDNEAEYFQKNSIKKLFIIPLFKYSVFAGFVLIHLKNNPNLWVKDFPDLIKILSEIISNAFSNNEAEKYRLEAEEEMLKLLRAVNQSTDAILILDKEFKIEYANNIYSVITGLQFEELLGQKPNFLSSDFNVKWNDKNVIENIKNGIPANAIFQDKKNNDESYWGKISISPIKNFNAEITNYLVLIEDITEKMIADTRREVSQKLESIGQLAAGIAHEINTPMQYIGDNNKFIETSINSLNIFTKELLNELENKSNICNELSEKIKTLKENYDIDFLLEEIPNAIKQSQEGINRVTTIIKAMKDFAHPGNKQMTFSDLNRGIEVTATISKNEWKYYADLKLELEPNLPLVYCLIDEINQVILNMIINSTHAIQEKFKNSKEKLGLIKISTYKENDFVVIKISDNGSGISPTIINRIFDPFFTTKEVGKGTGQGLSIAHDIIVNKHKGIINVNSEVGFGTTFTIKLPIVEKINE